MAKRLRVIHKPPGYEAWKDERPIARPNLKMLLLILGGVFSCGIIVAAAVGSTAWYKWGRPGPAPLPTLAVLVLPTSTATERYNVMVIDQVDVTATPTPAPTDPTIPTPDLEATINFMLSRPAPTIAMSKAMTTPPPTIAVETAAPIFCEEATFAAYPAGARLRVTFEEKSALRLLDRARVPGEREPRILTQLYDGHEVIITGEPVCGEWQGVPIAYYPVEVPHRANEAGYVGMGQSGDYWLEAVE